MGPVMTIGLTGACILVMVQVEALGTTEGSSSNLERVAEAPVDGAAVTVDYVPILRSGICADVGPRSYMEDAHVLVDDITGSLGGIELAQPSAFYGVYDGHMGLGAAKYVQDHILRLVVQDPAFPDEMAAAMKGAYVRADEDLESHWAENREGACSGTTALSVLITGRTAVVANTGDCRAVLSRKGKAIELSTDQKATSIGELARIQAAGGYVQDEYLNGQLGVARALGDWHMEDLKRRDEKAQLAGPLIPVPEVRELELNPDDEFLIIGSDGLWDKFDSQIAISFARKRLQQHNDPQQCSKELVAEAIRLDAVDNLTVVLVCFMETPPPQLKPIVKRSISVDGFQRLQGHIDTAGCSGW
eukprot:jgi/Mesen1/275/ME1151993C09512